MKPGHVLGCTVLIMEISVFEKKSVLALYTGFLLGIGEAKICSEK